MAIERTLCLIKPDAVRDNVIGQIVSRFESEGLRVCACKMMKLSKEKAEGFYIEHKDKSFYGPLISFMMSAPILATVVEGENAVSRSREIMGATNPAQAEEGTIRKKYAKSTMENAIHGSQSLGKAEREISYFFEKEELAQRFN